MSIEYGPEDRSRRLSALGLLASLCPPGDEEETMLQLELREHLLESWDTEILVEACRRLAKTWTWRKMPLPGDIDAVCRSVRTDARRIHHIQLEAERVKEARQMLPLPLAQKLLEEAKSVDEPTDQWTRLAHRIWIMGLERRIELDQKSVALAERNRT